MAYTDAQIKIINEQAKARPGQKYVTNSGKVYQGTTNNRLVQVEGIDVITVKKDITVNSRLTILEKDVDKLEEVTDKLEKIKADKCYALAMSIIL